MHLPKFLKTSLELYGWQYDMKEITALFDKYTVLELLIITISLGHCKIKRLQEHILSIT